MKVEAAATLGRRRIPGMTGMPSFLVCAVLGGGGSRDLQAVCLKGSFNLLLMKRVPAFLHCCLFSLPELRCWLTSAYWLWEVSLWWQCPPPSSPLRGDPDVQKGAVVVTMFTIMRSPAACSPGCPSAETAA